MLTFIIYAIISAIICYFMTKHSGMSWGWAWFFSLTFSLIIAWIFVVTSGKKDQNLKHNNRGTNWWNIKTALCFLIGAILLIYAFAHYPKDNSTYIVGVYLPDYDYQNDLRVFLISLFLGIGLVGNAIYLFSNADIRNNTSVDETSSPKIDLSCFDEEVKTSETASKWRKSLLLIGIVLFVTIIGFFIFSWVNLENNKKQQRSVMENTIKDVTNYRDSVQTPFKRALSKLDSLRESSSYYNVKDQKLLEIDSLKSVIKNEMNKIRTDSIDLMLKRMVPEFNQKVDTLIMQVQREN